jgi:hypothetical protein
MPSANTLRLGRPRARGLALRRRPALSPSDVIKRSYGHADVHIPAALSPCRYTVLRQTMCKEYISREITKVCN